MSEQVLIRRLRNDVKRPRLIAQLSRIRNQKGLSRQQLLELAQMEIGHYILYNRLNTTLNTLQLHFIVCSTHIIISSM